MNNLNKNRIRQSVNNMTNYKVMKLWTVSAKGTFASLGRLPSHYGVNKPVFVIKWVPPASGKGSSNVRNVIESLGYPIETYVNFNIDDVVESTKYFIEESNRRARNYLSRIHVNPNNVNKVVEALNTIQQNNAISLGKSYSQIRNGVGSSGKKLSNKLDIFLQQAIQLRKNITFETTGMSGFPEWLFTQKGLNNTNYDVHIVFPLVPFPITWERYRRRAALMLRSGKGFRFTSWKESARTQYRKPYDNFLNLITSTKKLNLLKSVTILPFEGRPLKYIVKSREGLRSQNLASIEAVVEKFRNSSVANQ